MLGFTLLHALFSNQKGQTDPFVTLDNRFIQAGLATASPLTQTLSVIVHPRLIIWI